MRELQKFNEEINKIDQIISRQDNEEPAIRDDIDSNINRANSQL